MKFARLIGYIALFASAVYLLTTLSRHSDALPPIAWKGPTIAIVVTCLGLYLIQVSAAGLAWHFWLAAVREPSRPRLAVSLFAISQFAKYVPGGIAQHLARVALGERHGLKPPAMIVTIALEQSWALIAGVVVAATASFFLESIPNGASLPSSMSWVLLVGIALIVPFAILLLGGRHRPSFLNRWLGAWSFAHPKPRTILLCLLLYAAGLVISGLSIDLVARYVFGMQNSHALLAIGAFAIAWVAGFVTPVSPGGIGVREAVLVAGLTSAYGPGVALAVALIHRILTAVGDALAFLIGLLMERRLATTDAAAERRPV
jgi:uncharacterized membrane protein YbhN (UPF0104 family)